MTDTFADAFSTTDLLVEENECLNVSGWLIARDHPTSTINFDHK
jgi:hypothetical protein